MRPPAPTKRPAAALPSRRPASGVRGFGAGVVLICALGGCSIFSPLPTNRGSIIEAVDYAKLVPGKSTRAEVTDLIGSPTAHATFDDNTWIYIGEITAPVPMARPKVEHQTVVVLSFDQGGVLRSRRVLNKNDSYDVAMASGKTPSPGSETSFMQELIGNVGRYSPLGGSGIGGASTLGNSENGYGHGGAGNTIGGP